MRAIVMRRMTTSALVGLLLPSCTPETAAKVTTMALHVATNTTSTIVVLSLGFILVYILYSLAWRRPISLQDIIGCVLCVGGLVGGVLVIFSGFFPLVREKLRDNDLYGYIGGLALLFVSVQGVLAMFKAKPALESPPPSGKRKTAFFLGAAIVALIVVWLLWQSGCAPASAAPS